MLHSEKKLLTVQEKPLSKIICLGKSQLCSNQYNLVGKLYKAEKNHENELKMTLSFSQKVTIIEGYCSIMKIDFKGK